MRTMRGVSGVTLCTVNKRAVPAGWRTRWVCGAGELAAFNGVSRTIQSCGDRFLLGIAEHNAV